MAAANKIQVGYIEPQDGAQFKVDEGTAAAPGICFVDSAATGLYSPGTGQIAWSTSGKQTALRILADGKVGVDCSPTVAFEVNGTIKASAIDAPIEGTLDDWIVHAGDTNTKFGFPAVDKFSVETNGAERFRIISTGKISNTYDGTPADPQYGQLELLKNGASNADPDWSYLSFHRVGQIAWQQGIDSNDFVIAKTGGSAKDTLDTERLRIKATTGDLLLGAHGSRIFDDSSGTNVVVDIYGGTTAGKRGILALGGRTGSDNADIGTIQFLNENNANATSSSHVQSKLVASIDVKSETTTSNSGANSGSHLIFSTKAENAALAERLRIKSDGQVSISSDGTTDGLLTIKGDSDQVGTPSIRLLDGSDTREVSISNTSGDFVASVHGNDNAIHGHIKMFESGIFDINNGGASGSNSPRFRIDTDGHVGIGRNTGLELLDVKGVDDDSIKFSASTYGGGHLRIAGADGTIAGVAGPYSHTTRFKTKSQNSNAGNGAERDALILHHEGWSGLHIASFPDGKVGIGTTAPSSPLVVDAGTTSNTTACQFKNDSTSAYAINDGGINNCLSLQSTGTNAAQSVGLQFSLDKSGETGCISEIGATRESNGNSTLVFRTRDSSTGRNERLRIDSQGKLLIGKTRTQYTNDYYDDITINNSGGSGAAGGTGITMISNASSWGALQFGDPDDDDCGYIKYDHNQNKMIFGIEDGSVRFWQTKAKTWFGTTGHGDGSRSTLFDLVGANEVPTSAWGQMGIYSSDSIAQDKGGSMVFGGQDGTTARQYFAGIQGAKENGTSGNYAGNLNFFTRPSGAVPKRRLRIESWGTLTAWEGPSQHNGNPGRLASGHLMEWASSHMSGGLATGWYPIIHLTDGCYLFLLKTGAHSSMLFTASNGYDPSNLSYINVLHFTRNANSSYLNIDGVRATSDGVIQVHLNASSSDYFSMQCQVLGPENISSSLSFYSTLTKETGSPTINDSKYPLTYAGYGGAMQLENVRIDGALDTGGSKNFRIPHPLSSLTGTKDLVHAAVEGPRADLIYRDKIDLVGGTATVNIDTVAGMTVGTFAVLTKNAQCFTTNETGWTNVKGSISGNILTITAQDNSCTDTISWMVVAQRKDANIINALATDSNGDLILEPPSPLVDTTGQAPDDSKPNEI